MGSKIVFVGNIPYEQTEEQLIEILSEVGPVVSFRLVFERETGKPRGYGFCEYQDERTGASAVRNLNGREIGNRSLKVDFAESDAASKSRDMDDLPPHLAYGVGGPTEAQANMAGQGPRMGGPPPMGQQQQALGQQQQGRIDPRLAKLQSQGQFPPQQGPSNPSQQPPQQQQLGMPGQGGPGGPGGLNSADAISAVLGTMTPQNVYDLISSMKVLGASEPDRARAILSQNPQLSYALFQALLMMNLVDPASLQRMFPQAGAPQPAGPPMQPMVGMPPQQMQHPFGPPGGAQPYPNMMPPQQMQHGGPMAPPPPTIEQQKELLAQVLALSPADLASLPEDQRANILQLRAQLGAV